MSNSHVQSAKAIAEDIAHLCCVPDDWRFQISDQAALPSPTLQLPQERNPLRIISINDVAELSKDGLFFTAAASQARCSGLNEAGKPDTSTGLNQNQDVTAQRL